LALLNFLTDVLFLVVLGIHTFVVAGENHRRSLGMAELSVASSGRLRHKTGPAEVRYEFSELARHK
jgi:uncharacterized protein with GYD domain